MEDEWTQEQHESRVRSIGDTRYFIAGWGICDVFSGSNTIHSLATPLMVTVRPAIVHLRLNSKLVSHTGLIICYPTHWSLDLARKTFETRVILDGQGS